MQKKKLQGIKIGVIGLGISGVAAANLAHSLGALVFVSESKRSSECKDHIKNLKNGINTEFGKHSSELLSMDMIVKSPGIPENIPILKRLRKNKVTVQSELEFSTRLLQSKKITAITGTNGKTTTTTLVGKIFKKAKRNTIVAGNIGSPLSSNVLKVSGNSNIIVEVSSYQLENSPTFHPHICAILNVAKDHLEHHKSLKNYINAKANIFTNQTNKDYCILNYDDPVCRRLAKKSKSDIVFFSARKKLSSGIFLADDRIVVKLPGFKAVFNSDIIKIPGMHNVENVLAAVSMSCAARINPKIIQSVISAFKGVEHRLESVKNINHVRYINDSKATNVDSTKVALESFSEPIWLIMGGQDKGFPYNPLYSLIKKKVKGILLVGTAALKIRRDLTGACNIYNCKTIANAVKVGCQKASPGEVVLLSPACASFDQFKNFEERGRYFKKMVRGLR